MYRERKHQDYSPEWPISTQFDHIITPKQNIVVILVVFYCIYPQLPNSLFFWYVGSQFLDFIMDRTCRLIFVEVAKRILFELLIVGSASFFSDQMVVFVGKERVR